MLRTYMDLESSGALDNSKGCDSGYSSLLFALSFYHAVCLERRKFGGLGWNISYGWMDKDLSIALLYLKMHVGERDSSQVRYNIYIVYT